MTRVEELNWVLLIDQAKTLTVIEMSVFSGRIAPREVKNFNLPKMPDNILKVEALTRIKGEYVDLVMLSRELTLTIFTLSLVGELKLHQKHHTFYCQRDMPNAAFLEFTDQIMTLKKGDGDNIHLLAVTR